ncbi:MAG TPA: ComF family protein [candidate division Zixibacteria bacterium]|nr:ComF family protein [candidate division Zixibacteria bacterium]
MIPRRNPFPADRFARLIDWLYPPRCRACRERIRGSDSEYFCVPCRGRIRLIQPPLCTICGRPFPDASGGDHRCGACLARPPRFSRARAWACYPREETDRAPLREVLHRFKYGRKIALGKPLGRLMALGCAGFLAQYASDLIVPVPLHPRRLRWRGFNQSVVLARQVSRVYAVPLDPFALRRVKETPPQTQLSEEERRRNVRGAFAVREGAELEGRRVLLIDDVYTSGATVNECARALLRAGAEEVCVLTLARTV